MKLWPALPVALLLLPAAAADPLGPSAKGRAYIGALQEGETDTPQEWLLYPNGCVFIESAFDIRFAVLYGSPSDQLVIYVPGSPPPGYFQASVGQVIETEAVQSDTCVDFTVSGESVETYSTYVVTSVEGGLLRG